MELRRKTSFEESLTIQIPNGSFNPSPMNKERVFDQNYYDLFEF